MLPRKRTCAAGKGTTVADYHGEESRLRGHRGAVTAVAFSPDEKLLASSGADNIVKLWDMTTGKELFTLRGHLAAVTSVCFSPDGARLVSGAGNVVKIWDVTTGKELASLPGHTAQVTSVAFSPDAVHVASGSEDKTVRVEQSDRADRMLFQKHDDAVASVAFDQDGQKLASLGQTQLLVWQPLTGLVVHSLRSSGRTVSVAFGSKGNRLAAAVNFPPQPDEARPAGQVTVWDLDVPKVIFSTKQSAVTVSQVAFSPDGSKLAQSSLDRTVKILEAESGKEPGNPASRFRCSCGDLQPGRATTGHRQPGGADSPVDCTQPKARTMGTPHGPMAIHVAFSPDGQRIAGDGDGTVLWDVHTGKELKRLSGGGFTRIAWCAVNNWLAGVDQANLTDPATGEVKTILQPPGVRMYPGGLSWAFSRDGKMVAIAGGCESAAVWDAITGQLLRTITMPKMYVSSVAFHPDGNHLAVARGFGAVFPRGSVKVWTISSGREVLSMEDGIEDGVWSVAYSPDGKLLAAASGYEHTKDASHAIPGEVWVWDAPTGAVVYRLRGHPSGTWCVSFSPDGKRLASAGGTRGSPSYPGEVVLGHADGARSCNTTGEGNRPGRCSASRSVRMGDALRLRAGMAPCESGTERRWPKRLPGMHPHEQGAG